MTWEAVVAGLLRQVVTAPLAVIAPLVVIAGLTRDLLNTRVVPIVKEMADPCPP